MLEQVPIISTLPIIGAVISSLGLFLGALIMWWVYALDKRLDSFEKNIDKVEAMVQLETGKLRDIIDSKLDRLEATLTPYLHLIGKFEAYHEGNSQRLANIDRRLDNALMQRRNRGGSEEGVP